jgi:hypothetical protein
MGLSVLLMNPHRIGGLLTPTLSSINVKEREKKLVSGRFRWRHEIPGMVIRRA